MCAIGGGRATPLPVFFGAALLELPALVESAAVAEDVVVVSGFADVPGGSGALAAAVSAVFGGSAGGFSPGSLIVSAAELAWLALDF